jgi:hypothetical protein
MGQKVFSENENLFISKTRNGSGVKVKRTFSKGENIFEVTGTLIACNEDDDIDDEIRNNTYRYDEELFLSPKGRIGDFLNHSCNPNSRLIKVGKKIFISAIKKILPNREVLIDYSTIIASDDSWKMLCNCGSLICRKKIGKFKLLPKDIKEKYIKNDIVPAYILEI